MHTGTANLLSSKVLCWKESMQQAVLLPTGHQLRAGPRLMATYKEHGVTTLIMLQTRMRIISMSSEGLQGARLRQE